MYYRNAQSALVVYDLTKPTSLVKAKHWVAELQRQASPGIVIGLVGNKLDLTKTATGGESEEGGSGSAAAATATAPAADGDDNDDGKTNPDESAGDARKISTQEGRTYAEEEGLLFFETSAKSGVNVQEVFTAIANAIPETQMKTSRGAAGAQGAGGAGQTALGADRVNLTSGQNDGAKEGCAC